MINGTCLDYLAESFMAGDPFNGGGFVVLNGVAFSPRGGLVELDTPYPGGNLFSLASGGAIFVRDPHHRVGQDQLNGGEFGAFEAGHWELIRPPLEENERLFGIPVSRLLEVEGGESTARKSLPCHCSRPPSGAPGRGGLGGALSGKLTSAEEGYCTTKTHTPSRRCQGIYLAPARR